MHSSWKKKTAIFLASQAVTLFGSSIVQFAMVWFVTLRTSSGFWVSMLTVCAYLPQFLISFVAGVWADRYSRKKLIILSDASIAVATLLLAVLYPYVRDDTLLLVVLMAASLIRSIGAGIQTPAVGAMIPQLVPEQHLMRVNGINATVQSVVQFVSPLAAGAILTVSTLRASLFIDIATAAVGIGLLTCLAIPKPLHAEQSEGVSVLADLKLGIRYAFADAFLGKLLMLYGAFIFLCVPAGFLATLFVSRAYGDTYVYLTIVELVGFAGMIAGGVLIGSWGGFANRMKTLAAGLAAFGALAVGMGVIDSFVFYLILMLFYGVALTMVQTAATTLVQEKAEMAMQGRVFGFFGAIYSGFLPLGMLVFGPLADRIPMRWIMVGSGVALLLMVLWVLGQKGFYRAGIKPAADSAE